MFINRTQSRAQKHLQAQHLMLRFPADTKLRPFPATHDLPAPPEDEIVKNYFERLRRERNKTSLTLPKSLSPVPKPPTVAEEYVFHKDLERRLRLKAQEQLRRKPVSRKRITLERPELRMKRNIQDLEQRMGLAQETAAQKVEKILHRKETQGNIKLL